MCLGVSEGRECTLVDGGEVDEYHVESTTPAVGVCWCAFVNDGG